MPLSRRQMLTSSAAIAAAAACSALPAAEPHPAALAPEDFKVTNNRIKQSAMGWMLGIPSDILIDACHKMGMAAVESVGDEPARLAQVRKLGMHIGYIGSHSYQKGPLDPANHAECEKKLRAGIGLAARFDSQNVITFTGYRVAGISDEQAKKNCIELWKKVIPFAEEKKVNLILEILNTRDTTHPMKGHPGYFGDHLDLCIDLIKKVDSPRMKLLFDIYHVQVMDGDVIRHIHQLKDYIAHVHTAGVPGRGELGDWQELNYPAVMKALLDINYTGFVAQEFIPTWPDKVAALRYAVRLCDV